MKLLFKFTIVGNKHKFGYTTEFDQNLYDKLNNIVYKNIYIHINFNYCKRVKHKVKSLDINIVNDDYITHNNEYMFEDRFYETIMYFQIILYDSQMIDQIIQLIDISNKHTQYIYYKLLLRCCKWHKVFIEASCIGATVHYDKLIDLLKLHITEDLNYLVIKKELEDTDLYDDNTLCIINTLIDNSTTLILQYYHYMHNYQYHANPKVNRYFESKNIDNTIMYSPPDSVDLIRNMYRYKY